jgi:hypothetical protein
VTLRDFTDAEVAELNRRYGSPLKSEADVARFFGLVGGHPYLVRQGLHAMTPAPSLSIADFEKQADRDEGVYGDHLRRLLHCLRQDAALCEAVRAVLGGAPCPTEESFYRLQSAGVLMGTCAGDARLRCRLYQTYLERRL